MELIQYSDEWYAARAGKQTGSIASIIMGKPGTKGLDEVTSLLAWERVYGPAPLEEHYESKAMTRGKEKESPARTWYLMDTDNLVEQVGFQQHPVLSFVGCSPDGVLRAERRTVQIKSPNAKAWSCIKVDREVPSEYRWQCVWEPWCFGWEDFEFVAWHPTSGGVIVPGRVSASQRDQMDEHAWRAEGIIREKEERMRQ